MNLKSDRPSTPRLTILNPQIRPMDSPKTIEQRPRGVRSVKVSSHGKPFDGMRARASCENTESLNDNLQKLRKRIRKLSRRVVEEEKKNFINLYEHPAQMITKREETNAPAYTIEERENEDSKKNVRAKKRKKRKKHTVQTLETVSSTSTSHSDGSSEYSKNRKTDLFRLIKEKEDILHAGNESDVDTDFTPKATPPAKMVRNHQYEVAKLPTHNTLITEMVSSTIAKLNTVNDSVQKVIGESISTSVVSAINSVTSSKRSVRSYDSRKSSQISYLASVNSDYTRVVSSDRMIQSPMSVPEYLGQNQKKVISMIAKTPTKKKKPKKPREPKEGTLPISTTPKENKIDMATAKPALKKSGVKRKQKKEHVLFTEVPEMSPIQPQKSQTPIRKVLSENPKDVKQKRTKRSKRERQESPPPNLEEPEEKEKKKMKLKKISIDIPCSIESKEIVRKENIPPLKETQEKHETSKEPLSAKDICRKMRKNTTHTLTNLNAQMSSTLKESIAHLNDICMRVRTTLSDMEKEHDQYNRKIRCTDLFSDTAAMESDNISVVSIHTDVTIEERRNPLRVHKSQEENVSSERTPPKKYTVVKQLGREETIDRILTSISMSGDDFPVQEIQTEKEKRRLKRKARKAKKLKELANQTSKGDQEEQKPELERPQSVRIPIWDRKPPSIINDIQMTVKRQATRSQYKEFMRNMKRESKKIKPSTIVLPQISKTSIDQNWYGQGKPIKQAASSYQKIKEGSDNLEHSVSRRTKRCATCSSEKCTCGITVENIHPATSAQKMQWIKTRSALARRGIQAYDILDEITLKDLEPLQSEYPRKDHITTEEETAKVEDTLLYRLLYNERPEVLENLLRSCAESQKGDRYDSSENSLKREELEHSLNMVSKAYQMYEKLELGTDAPPTPLRATRTKSIPIKNISERLKSPSSRTKKLMQTCHKEFNDTVNIPVDLITLSEEPKRKPPKGSPSKFCNIQLRTDNGVGDAKRKKKVESKKLTKKLSSKSISSGATKKKGKQRKFEYIKPKLKPYLIDPNLNIKNILTVMRASVFPNNISKIDDKLNPSAKDLTISEENKKLISTMTKREVVHTLKPYIFMDIKPVEIIVMPVQTKYPHQPQPVAHYPTATASRTRANEKEIKRTGVKSPQKKSTTGTYCKDHGDNPTPSIRKVCRRCQQKPSTDSATSRSSLRKTSDINYQVKKINSNRSSRTQTSNPLLENVSLTEQTDIIHHNAILTRNKLNEVKNLVNRNKAFFPKDLNRAIGDIEYKIANVLSNPNSQHTEAFIEIEDEIKAILKTMGGTAKRIAKANGRIENQERPSSPHSVQTFTIDEIEIESCGLSIVGGSSNNISKSSMNYENAEQTQDEKGEQVDFDKVDIKLVEKTFQVDDFSQIERALKGMDTIINIESESDEKQSIPTNTDVSLWPSSVGHTDDDVGHTASKSQNVDCDKFVSNFCEQVDKAIEQMTRTDDAQTDISFESPSDDLLTNRSDDYLTPYMRAVKDYRNGVVKSQSFMDFLDKLSNLSSSHDRLVPLDSCGETSPATTNLCDDVSQATCRTQDTSHQIDLDNMIDEHTMCDDLDSKSATGEQAGDFFQISIQCQTIPTKQEFNEVEEYVKRCCMEEESQKVEVLKETKAVITRSRTPTQVTRRRPSTPVQSYVNVRPSSAEPRYSSRCTPQVRSASTEPIRQSIEQKRIPPKPKQETTFKKTDMATMVSLESINPTSTEGTQIPTDPKHKCFTEASTVNTQVTEELKNMFTETRECQARRDLSFNVFTASISSPTSTFTMPSQGSVGVETDENLSTSKVDRGTVVDSEDNIVGESDSSFIPNQCPVEETRTDTYLLDGKEKRLDALLSKNAISLDLISLFDSRKVADEFIGKYQGKENSDSTNQLLQAISQLLAEADDASSTTMYASVSPRKHTIEKKSSGDFNENLSKQTESNHAKLLNSFYGLLFTIMFLGLNLSYTC